jgi:nucleotide-binding universal stress UspA family protein
VIVQGFTVDAPSKYRARGYVSEEETNLAISTVGKQAPKTDAAFRFQRILIAVDGSEGSRKASEVAVDLAEKFNAQLYVVHAFRGYPEYLTMFPGAPAPSGTAMESYEAYARKAALDVVGRTVSMAEMKGLKAKSHTTETMGSVVQAITDFATSEKVDLIVMGTRGLGGFKKMLLGSVSSGVVTHAPCAVLVVR